VDGERSNAIPSAPLPTSTAQVWERVGILAREVFDGTHAERAQRGASGRLSLTQNGLDDSWSCVVAIGGHSWLGDDCATPDAAIASALHVAGGAR
jgi:hypothetical protein